jgi:CRISPR system Cascade subunit CasB
MRRQLFFRTDPQAASALLAWHRALQEDRGARARLRRAPTPVEVSYEPAYHRLLHALAPLVGGDSLEIRLGVAAVAGLAARVEEHVPGTPMAAQMAIPGRGRDAPPVSESRLRRLLAAEEPAERYAQLARIVRLLGTRVDLLSLADAAYCWDPRTRQQWAYDYYENAPTASRTGRGAQAP